MQLIGLQLLVLGHNNVLNPPVCSKAAYDRHIMTIDCIYTVTSHCYQQQLTAYLGMALKAIGVESLLCDVFGDILVLRVNHEKL